MHVIALIMIILCMLIHYLNKAININESNADAYFLRGLTKKTYRKRRNLFRY